MRYLGRCGQKDARNFYEKKATESVLLNVGKSELIFSAKTAIPTKIQRKTAIPPAKNLLNFFLPATCSGSANDRLDGVLLIGRQYGWSAVQTSFEHEWLIATLKCLLSVPFNGYQL